MYEIIMKSFLCCFDFLIVLMLFHHFLLDRWEKSILGIIIKAISVLVCGVSLACINFFGVFWLNVIVAVILNLSMALSFYAHLCCINQKYQHFQKDSKNNFYSY